MLGDGRCCGHVEVQPLLVSWISGLVSLGSPKAQPLESTGERAQLVVSGSGAVWAGACPSRSLESGPQPFREASAQSEKPRQKLAHEREGRGGRLPFSVLCACTFRGFDTCGPEMRHALGSPLFG